MVDVLRLFAYLLLGLFKSPVRLQAENTALRHQLNVLCRSAPKKLRLTAADRLLFVWLLRTFPSIRDAIQIIQPETILRWHRRGFRFYWRWKSRSLGGRPRIPAELRQLIREMSLANPLWGAPRIHGELLKLGIDVAQSTVAKYMARRGRGPSQTWGTFLRNHAAGIAAMDFLVVPTAGFQLLFAWVVLSHDRRQFLSFGVTAHPTAKWVAGQITEAFPWDEAPNYLLRDRDTAYGRAVTKRLKAMGIRDRPIAPRSPWQNGHVERLIGSIRRECLDHVVVFGEAHLRRILTEYASYYNAVRTHLALDKDAPCHRPIQRRGSVTARPILGGLHHHYARM
jgi:transposase InsO family protein